MRLNKYLQQCGVGSRREAERLIAQARVTVDGITACMTTQVHPASVVALDGVPQVIGAQTHRIFAYHKPVGVLVTARDPQGRPTLYDELARMDPAGALPRLMPVGRLDMASEGLLLLTNDGVLAQTLMSPKTALRRVYKVRVFGSLNARQLDMVRRGMRISRTQFGEAEIDEIAPDAQPHLAPPNPRNNRWYRVVLREGKNREIRRIFEHLGCKVNRLVRTDYGPWQLADLPKGMLREVPVLAWEKES